MNNNILFIIFLEFLINCANEKSFYKKVNKLLLK